MNTLPKALVVGPMKAGTSWVHDYLHVRGDVALPDGVKETFFFDTRYDKGVDWYASHFGHYDSSSHRQCVEVAPSYFHCAEAPARIHDTLGEVPLVVTLRDPVRRAWSHYLHLRRYGYTRLPLREAVAAFPEILEASRYKTGLARWEAIFGREHIHVLWQEDLGQSPDVYARQLCKGLGLDFVPLADGSSSKQNEAAMPASATLAAFGDSAAHFLRSYRLYGVVNAAKRVGLKKLFFGRPGAKTLPTLGSEDAAWLASELAGEVPAWALKEKMYTDEQPDEKNAYA